MAGLPSVGDILMLSQVAWKIGRAFNAGQKLAPAEFQDIESEVNSLATSLKLLVEALFNDSPENGGQANGGGLLAQADRKTKLSMATILMSCQRTLQDLDSLVQRYQDIKTYQTADGETIKDKGWSEIVLRSYASMMWTAEGGTVTDLRDMLHLHTGTVMLTVHALQSHSLERLQRTVIPIAAKVDDIHGSSGELFERMEDLNNVLLDIAGNQAPHLPPQRETAESVISSMELDANSLQSRTRSLKNNAALPASRNTSNARSNNSATSPRSLQSLARDIAQLRLSGDMRPPSLSDHPLFRPQAEPRSSEEPLETSSSNRLSSASSDVLGWDQPSIVQDSTGSNPRFSLNGGNIEMPDVFPERYAGESIFTKSDGGSIAHPWAPPESSASSIQEPYSPDLEPVATSTFYNPRGMSGSIHRPIGSEGFGERMSLSSTSRTKSLQNDNSSRVSRTSSERIDRSDKGVSTREEQAEFERTAFRNTAILCDVGATLVEYTLPLDPSLHRLDQEIAEACKECRVCLVRKRGVLADGAVRLSTSIWVFSTDGKVRLQQRLVDGSEIIPYASYFTQNKVSLPIPDSELVYHPITFGGVGEKVVKTSWINYVFEDASGAAQFQSLLFGRTLTHSFRTEKTLRLHEGFKGRVAYQEQLCAIELLRIWVDDLPDMDGNRGVLAMIHFSGQFRAGEGYLAFWLNSIDAPVRIKDDGGKSVKIKGLHVAVERLGGSEGRKMALVGSRRDSGVHPLDSNSSIASYSGESERSRRMTESSGSKKEEKGKWVTGAKIEFADEGQKFGFLDVVRSCERLRLQLPELAV